MRPSVKLFLFACLFLPMTLLSAQNEKTQAAIPLFANPNAKLLWEQVVYPVVQNRMRFVEVEESQDSLIVRSTTRAGGTRLIYGEYRFAFANDMTDLDGNRIDIDSTDLHLQNVTQGSNSHMRVNGTLKLAQSLLKNQKYFEAQGGFRSLLIADPLLHPQTSPLTEPNLIELSEPQVDVLKQLEEIERITLQNQQPMRAVVLMPTGLGKTVLAIKLTLRRWKQLSPHRPGRVLFILQDTEVLRKNGKRFAQALGLDSSQAFIQPEGELKRADLLKASQDPRVRMFFVTRSFAVNNLDILEKQTQLSPFSIFLDEVHHAGIFSSDEEKEALKAQGLKPGEFQRILERLISRLRPDSQVIGLSGTPWHRDSDFLQKWFGGNLAVAFTSKAEREKFAKERDYVNLSRMTTLRAIAQGYLASTHQYRQTLLLDDQTESMEFLRRTGDYAREYDQSSNKKTELGRQITIHKPFIDVLMKDIEDRIAHPDFAASAYIRGMIFVPSIAHANVYAAILNELATKNRQSVQFQAYHSGMNAEDRRNAINWFEDLVAGTRQRKTSHRYMLVVRALTEGYDLSEVNHVVLARNFSLDDLVGIRMLLQSIGRGLRASFYKTSLRLTDFSGRMWDLMYGKLDPLTIGDVRPRLLAEPTKALPEEVVVQENAVSKKDFVTQDVAIDAALAASFKEEFERILTLTNPKWYEREVRANAVLPSLGIPPERLRIIQGFVKGWTNNFNNTFPLSHFIPVDPITGYRDYDIPLFRDHKAVVASGISEKSSTAAYSLSRSTTLMGGGLSIDYEQININRPNPALSIPTYPDGHLFDLTYVANKASAKGIENLTWWEARRLLKEDKLIPTKSSILASDFELYHFTPKMIENSFLVVVSNNSPWAHFLIRTFLLKKNPTQLDLYCTILLQGLYQQGHFRDPREILIVDRLAAEPVRFKPEFLAELQSHAAKRLARLKSYGLPFGREVDRKTIGKSISKKFGDGSAFQCKVLF